MPPRTLSVAACALGLALTPVRAAPGAERMVTKCPQGTQPARTMDSRAPWACVLVKKGTQEFKPLGCPSGYHTVTTPDTFDPFKCALDGISLHAPRVLCPAGEQAEPTADPAKEFECRKVEGGGFLSGPSCPKGTRPVPTPGALKPFRCFADETPAPTDPTAEPRFPERAGRSKERAGVPGASYAPGTAGSGKAPAAAVCPKGTKKIQTEDPFEPVRCVPASSGPAASPKPARFSRYRVTGEVAFDYPSDWHLTDAWTDEVPSVYLLYSPRGGGKQVSLTVTRQRHGTPSFKEMAESIEREKEWHKAAETGRGKVSGFEAVFLGVPQESDTAFIDTGDGYFVVSFNAPPELYGLYLPAYKRALKSFRVREASRQ